MIKTLKAIQTSVWVLGIFILVAITGVAIQVDNIERNLTRTDKALTAIEKKLGIEL